MNKLSYIVLIFISLSCSNRLQLIYPEGTTKLTENIYIDEFVVTNLEYRQFLYSVNHFWSKESSVFLGNLPRYGLTMDAKQMKSFNIADVTLDFSSYTNDKITLYGYIGINPNSLIKEVMPPLHKIVFDSLDLGTYLNHPVYFYYPVLYISQYQAELFCKWKADMENLRISLTAKNAKDYSSYVSSKSYRLPLKKEWMMAYDIASKNKIRKLKKHSQNSSDPIDGKYTLYNPKNKFHFYTQPNNLFEIISDSLIIGADAIRHDSIVVNNYKKPEKALGFRCVCEID